MNFFNHPGLQAFFFMFGIFDFMVAAMGIWKALKMKKRDPSQSSLHFDYNKKMTRITWILGAGSFLLFIFVIYFSTIIPSNQENLFIFSMIIFFGIFYFPIFYKANHYEQDEDRKS